MKGEFDESSDESSDSAEEPAAKVPVAPPKRKRKEVGP